MKQSDAKTLTQTDDSAQDRIASPAARKRQFSLAGLLLVVTCACGIFAAVRSPTLRILLTVPALSWVLTIVVLMLVAALMRDLHHGMASRDWRRMSDWVRWNNLLAVPLFCAFVALPLVLIGADAKDPFDYQLLLWSSGIGILLGIGFALWRLTDPNFDAND